MNKTTENPDVVKAADTKAAAVAKSVVSHTDEKIPTANGTITAPPDLAKRITFSVGIYSFVYPVQTLNAELVVRCGMMEEKTSLLLFLLQFISDLHPDDLETLLEEIKQTMPKKTRKREVKLPEIKE